MTIERWWVRDFLSTPARMAATGLALFALIVVAPIVLAVVGLGLIALAVFVVGVAALAALVLALLPGRHHRR